MFNLKFATLIISQTLSYFVLDFSRLYLDLPVIATINKIFVIVSIILDINIYLLNYCYRMMKRLETIELFRLEEDENESTNVDINTENNLEDNEEKPKENHEEDCHSDNSLENEIEKLSFEIDTDLHLRTNVEEKYDDENLDIEYRNAIKGLIDLSSREDF